MKKFEDRAKKEAIELHTSVNHMYGEYPYSHHLNMVVAIASQMIHLILEEDRDEVISAAWLHDTIEDTRVSYNDIKNKFNESIAEYVFALTNEKGRTRKDRANDKYYEGILDYKHAAYIKICDRYANTLYSKILKSSMFTKYKKEFPEFKEKLYDGRYDELWNKLEKLYYDDAK